MAVKSRLALQGIFVTGAKPLQQDFTDWLDSFRHITENSTGTAPTTPVNSDMWYNATINQFQGMRAGATSNFLMGSDAILNQNASQQTGNAWLSGNIKTGSITTTGNSGGIFGSFDNQIQGRIAIGDLFTGAGSDGQLTINIANKNMAPLTVISNNAGNIAAIFRNGSGMFNQIKVGDTSVGTAGGGHHMGGYNFDNSEVWILPQNLPLRILPSGVNYSNQPVIIGNATTDGSKLQVDGTLSISGVSNYTDNTAAVAAGLPVGRLYRTGDDLKIVH